MTGFESSVPVALESFFSPNPVSSYNLFAVASMAEITTDGSRSDHSIPGSATCRGLEAQRLGSVRMPGSAASRSRSHKLLYSSEWQVELDSAPLSKRIGRDNITWALATANAKRITRQAISRSSASNALRAMQILQSRKLKESLIVVLPISGSRDGNRPALSSTAAMLKVAASESKDSSFTVHYENASGRYLSMKHESASDAFGRYHNAGLQFQSKLLPLEETSKSLPVSYGSNYMGQIIISGGLGGEGLNSSMRLSPVSNFYTKERVHISLQYKDAAI